MAEVQGLNKWQRQVQRLPEAAKRALRESQAKNAEKLANSIRAFVPRGKTNRLFKSVNWRQGPPPFGGGIIAQKILTDRQLALMDGDLLYSVWVGDDAAYYARFVEFGTKYSPAGKNRKWDRVRTARGWRNKAEGRNIARAHHATKAKPFFYPVIRAYRDKIRRSTASAASRGIKKAVTG